MNSHTTATTKPAARQSQDKATSKRDYIEPIPGYTQPCRDPEHHAPRHICIPAGQQWHHFCPTCGHEEIIQGSTATL